MESERESRPPTTTPGPFRASVVVPTYERTDLLLTLLVSLAEQRLDTGVFELVVTDDGSGPAVKQMVDEYAPRFAHVTFVTGPNAGPGVARNRGVDAAASDLLVFVDSDCIAQPGWLEALCRAVEGGADMAHGPIRSTVPMFEPFVHTLETEDALISAGNFAITRTAFVRVGGYHPPLSRFAEDIDLFSRVKRHALRIAFVRDAVVMHRPRPRRVKPLGQLWRDPKWLATESSLRELFARCPELVAVRARANRRKLARSLAKLAFAVAPVAVFPVFPPLWGLGYGAFLGHSLLKRRRANAALAAARESFRVPLADALRYAALQPVMEFVEFIGARRAGVGFLRAPAPGR